MKKLLLLFLFIITSVTLWSQNEFKYVIYAYDGLKIGTEARIADMAEVDSVKEVGSELVFYIGGVPYFVGDAIPVDLTTFEDSITKHTDTLQLHQGQISVLNSFYNDEIGDNIFADSLHKVYLSLTGSDITGDGSEESPFLTTKKAVESISSYTAGGHWSQFLFIYGVGIWDQQEVFPYLDRVNSSYAPIAIVGTAIIGDTINVTHPGTSTQSYFRFNTDSTLVGDLSRTFIGTGINDYADFALTYPVISNTTSTFMACGKSDLIGINRFLVTLGTKFQADSTYDYANFINRVNFYNIDFVQAHEEAAWNFGPTRVSFISCKFTADYPAYDQLGIRGQGNIYNSIIEHDGSSGSGDALEFSGASSNVMMNSYLYSSTDRASGAQGLEIRPGVTIDVYSCAFEGFDEAIKNDGNSPMAIGAIYAKSNNTLFHLHDPRKQFLTESEYTYSAGLDSIICDDVTYLFNFNDTYDAGRDVLLPHLKAGGYDQFSVSGNFLNNTVDYGNLVEITVGSGEDGISTLIVDTIKTIEIYEDISVEDALDTIHMFIDHSGSDITGDGSQGNPVATFERAIELAPDFIMNSAYFSFPISTAGLYIHLGAGEWLWSGIKPHMPDYSIRFIGDSLEYIRTIDITQQNSEYKYTYDGAGISTNELKDKWLEGTFNYIPIAENNGDSIWLVTGPDGDQPIGLVDVYDTATTFIKLDQGKFSAGIENVYKLIHFIGTDYPSLPYSRSKIIESFYCQFNSCEFTFSSLHIENVLGATFHNSIFNLYDYLYHHSSANIHYQGVKIEGVDGVRSMNGFDWRSGNNNCYIDGWFENFASGIKIGRASHQFGEVYIKDCDIGIDFTHFGNLSRFAYSKEPLLMRDVDLAVSLDHGNTAYQVWYSDFRIVEDVPVIADVPINVYDLDNDSYLFINKDTATKDHIVTADIPIVQGYPDSIDMNDYYRSDENRNIWKWRDGTTKLVMGSVPNFLEQSQDTFQVSGYLDGNLWLRSKDTYYYTDTVLTGRTFANIDAERIQKWKQTYFYGKSFSIFITPETGDTVDIEWLEGQSLLISTNDSRGTDRINIGEVKVLELGLRLDAETAVDSATMLSLEFDDAGIDPDSIGKLYTIKNIDDGLRGADATYFLYSEYGDNYLNGRLDVDGQITEHYPASIDFNDYSETPYPIWNYRQGSTDVDVVTGSYNGLYMNLDTFNIISGVDATTKFTLKSDYSIIYSDEKLSSFSNKLITTEIPNLKSESLYDHYISSRLNPKANDTVQIDLWVPLIIGGTTITPATSLIDIGEERMIDIFAGFDDYMVVDSFAAINFRLDNRGIDPDSLGKLYVIKNLDEGARGVDGTYFLYSEYGDNYLNGKLKITDSLQLINGAGLDQYGRVILLGGDTSDHLDRTDAAAKSGMVVIPHYTNAEESIVAMSGLSGAAQNILYIGGGIADFNTVTSMQFLAANDQTTLGGTTISKIDIDGFHVDSISELNTDVGVYIEGTHFEDDTVVIAGDLEVTGLIKNTPPHAAMSFDRESETLTMSDDVWVKITNATDDLFSTVDAVNFTQAGDSLTIDIPGKYKIEVSISFSGTTNADLYEFAVFENEVLASIRMPRSTTSTDVGNVSFTSTISGLVAGDDLSLRVQNTANDFDATIIAISWVTTLLNTE